MDRASTTLYLLCQCLVKAQHFGCVVLKMYEDSTGPQSPGKRGGGAF